jgi:L-fucose isomerase-like protein
MTRHPEPGVIAMTQTAALTQEERAEIRALVERLSRRADGMEILYPHLWPTWVLTRDAATALPRLLDALEAAERERDALAEANWKGSALLLGARDTLEMIAADSHPWHTCTHAEDAQRALEDSAP